MNLEMTVRTQQDKVCEICKRLVQEIFVSCLSTWINVVNVKAAIAFAIAANSAFAAEHIKYRLAPFLSVLLIPFLERLRSAFNASFLGVIEKIVSTLFSVLLKPLRPSFLPVNGAALCTSDMPAGVWNKSLETSQAPAGVKPFAYVALAVGYCVFIHDSKYNQKTWKAFGTIA
jgi:hypothetical protein